MKLEIGESVILSWLRHVRGCVAVQMHWKPSPTWPLERRAALAERWSAIRSWSEQIEGPPILGSASDSGGDKIGAHVRATMATLTAAGRLPPEVVGDLLDARYCKATFRLSHPFLKRLDPTTKFRAAAEGRERVRALLEGAAENRRPQFPDVQPVVRVAATGI
jgi:hypothetical protein